MVVAFLLAAPELGPDAVAMSARFLGWELAALRWVGVLGATLVAAVVVARFADPGEVEPPGAGGSSGLRSAFDETVLHVGPLLLVGVVVAALIQVFALDSDLGRLEASGWSLPVVSLVAVPTYVSSAAGSPLAAVLWAKGLGPGAALCWVLIGPVTNGAVPAFLAGAYGRRAAVVGLGAYVAVCWCVAAIAEATVEGPPPEVSMDGLASTGSVVAAVVLAALLLRSMWQAGAREWLGEIAGSGAGHRHVHGHDHDHDAHGHGH
jgi:uncharacterized membrane protein YraQ (UPF0718 family)